MPKKSLRLFLFIYFATECEMVAPPTEACVHWSTNPKESSLTVNLDVQLWHKRDEGFMTSGIMAFIQLWFIARQRESRLGTRGHKPGRLV